MLNDQPYSKPWHNHNNLFKHFQGNLRIFRDIDVYSATLTGAQLGGRTGGYPLPFFENRKKGSDFSGKRLWLCPSLGQILHYSFKSI